MAFFFNEPQRSVLPQVVEALQRLQNDPQHLSYERDRRYNEPPPPYSESGETTQPATPGPPVVDQSYQHELRKLARYKSTPLNQFRSQAKRERERLEHQISEERFGRRQTLPWDDSSDLQANSENNIRSRWVEQGVWGDEWGPAWPKDSHPMTTKWEHRGGGPFFGPYNPTTSESRPGARWGHEEPDPEPGSESEPELESEPQLEPGQERRPIFGIFGLGAGQPEQREPRPRPIKYIQTQLGPLPQYPIPTPTVRDPEASRPYHQFLYQISKERDWIKDELDYKAPGTAVDLDAMAYQSVQDNWIKDGIWNSKWGELPGMTWLYEEPEEEELVEVPAATGAAGGQPQDTSDHSEQQARGPPCANISGPAPIPSTDGGSATAPGDAQASNAGGRTGGRMRGASRGHPAVTHSALGSEHAPRRSLRIARSSQAEQDVPSPTRQSKRSRCSDTVEDEQPSKRLRRNNNQELIPPRNAPDAVDTNKPHGSRTSLTKGAVEVRAQSCNQKAASTSRETGGKRNRTVSNPIRRSTRIAERATKRKANMAGEPPSRPPQTKATKRGRPKRQTSMAR